MNNVFQKLANFIKEHKNNRRWRKVLVCLSAVVVFCTVYALILPAITMEATCGMEDHAHSAECYEVKVSSDREMACALETHEHTEACKDAEGNIICGKADFVVHSHNEDCYQDGLLICTLPEIAEHAHTEECSAQGEENACTLNEVALHTHDETCYDENDKLVCGKLEVLEHVHTTECFKVTNTSEESILVCGKTEHTHNDSCYPKVVESTEKEQTLVQSALDTLNEVIDELTLEELSGTVGTIDWRLVPNADNLTYTLELSGEGALPNNFLSSTMAGAQKNATTVVVINPNEEDNITSIGSSAFKDCTRIKEVSLSSKVTTIGSSAFEGCTGLEKIILKNGAIETVGSDIFGSDVSFELVVGKEATVLSKTFMDAAIANISTITFEGPNEVALPDMTAHAKLPAGLQDASGACFVDGQGVLYKLNSNTATVIYVPADLTAYTVPATITANSGTYTVNAVGSEAFYKMDGLAAVAFTAPENITNISAYAFSNLPALTSVNGETTVSGAEAIFSKATIGTSAFYKTGLTGESLAETQIRDKIQLGQAADGGAIIGLITDGPEKFPEAERAKYPEQTGDKYRYYTGQRSMSRVSISPVDNTIAENKVARLYIAFSTEDGKPYGKTPGNVPPISINQTTFYYYDLYETSVDNLYYFEFPMISSGKTLAIDVELFYPSPSSEGGTAKIWIELADKGTKPSFAPPANYQLFEWITKRDSFDVNKSYVSDSAQMVSNSTGDKLYLANMQFEIDMTRDTAGSSATNGKDFLKSVDFEDKLELPENFKWREDVIEAIKNHNENERTYTVIDDSDNGVIEFKLVSTNEIICKLSSSYNTNTEAIPAESESCYLKVDENNQLSVCWTYIKGTDTNGNLLLEELNNFSETLTFGDNIIEVVSSDNLPVGGTVNFTNNINAVQNYTHSDNKAVSSSCTAPFECEPAVLKMEMFASRTQGQTWLTTPANARQGYRQWYKISLSNTGVLPYETPSYLEDTLDSTYFITGADLQTMFDEDKDQRLCITINNATLSGPIEHEVIGIANPDITYIVTSQFEGTNTDYPYNEKGNSVSTNTECVYDDDCENEIDNVKMTLKWENADLTLVVDKGEGYSLESYTIGAGKDYSDVQTAFDKIGFVVVPETEYTVVWNLEDNFRILAGQNHDFIIRSTVKSTFMLLSSDKAWMFYKYDFIDKNSATIYDVDKNQVESISCQSQKAYSLGYDWKISEDIFLLDGTMIDNDSLVEAGKVLKYTSKMERYAEDVRYSALPLVEQMTGAQVLMVPVTENAGRDWTEGLPVHTEGEKDYYLFTLKENESQRVFDKVFLGETWADKVIVTAMEGGGLETRVYRYVENVSRTGDFTVNLYMLVNPTLAGYDETGISSYKIAARPWLNDHETHRLVGSNSMPITTPIRFSKEILNDDGTPDEDDESLVAEDDSVTYRISLWIDGAEGETRTFSGTDLCDQLPQALNNYWQKQTVDAQGKMQGNVSVTYKYPDNYPEGLEPPVSDPSADGWVVNNKAQNGGTSSKTQQYINWDNCKFTLTNEPLYIYVTLTYPSEDTAVTWTEYVEKYGGNGVINAIYVFELKDEVTHMLKAPVQGFLQAGIYSTGIGREKTSVSTSNFYSYEAFTAENSRDVYVNDSADRGVVMYYYTIVNSGNTRMYLNKIQSILPKGFTFVKAAYSSYESSITNHTFLPHDGYKNSTSTIVYQTSDRLSVRDVTYQLQGIKQGTCVTETLSNGRQKVTLDFSRNSWSFWDEENSQFFIPPKNGIQFTFFCYTNGYADTEDAATALVAMPLDDYTGGGFELNKEAFVTVNDEVVEGNTTDIAQNDGDRQVLNATEAAAEGLTVEDGENQWFASEVTIYRESGITPGVSKSVYSVVDEEGNEGFDERSTAGSTSAETIGWKVTAVNDGGSVMTDYTLTDIMEKPYSFAAGSAGKEMMYKIYDSEGTLIETVPLGTLRKEDGKIYLDSYYWYRDNINSYSEKQSEIRNTELIEGLPQEILYYENKVISSNIKESKIEVTIDTNDDGNEVLTLRFMADRFAIPAGGKAELIVYTKDLDREYDTNKLYCNTVQLKPSQEFSNVVVGEHDRKEKTVTSVAYMAVSYGFFTSSRVEVYETADPDNDASSMGAKNFITIPTGEEEFTYKLSLTNYTEKVIDRVLVVDSLPEANPDEDFTPFGEYRGSNLKVDLAGDNPVFDVTVITKTLNEDGETYTENRTTLNSDKYTVLFSEKTPAIFANMPEDTDAERKLKTAMQKVYWGKELSDDEKTALQQSEYAAWLNTEHWSETATANTRSVRVEIVDETATLIPDGAVIEISFKAKVADKLSDTENQVVERGQTALNSFGYAYHLNELDIELESSPISVGVKVAYVPVLVKEVENTMGNAFDKAKVDKNFKFVLYTGRALDLNEDFTEQDLAEALLSGGRKFSYISLDVLKGSALSEELILENVKEYTYSETDGWTATDNDWIWNEENSEGYTLVELPETDLDTEYHFGSIGGVARNSYHFTYDPASDFLINVINIHEDWAINVQKYSVVQDENGNNKPLAGAVFGLYSKDSTDALTDEAYAALVDYVHKDVDRTVVDEESGVTYYLADYGTSSVEDGTCLFDSLSLNNEEYIVRELVPPSGFLIDETPKTVLKSSATESIATIEVINVGGHILPHTGGYGTTPYIIVGLLIMSIATYYIYKQAKRRKEAKKSFSK